MILADAVNYCENSTETYAILSQTCSRFNETVKPLNSRYLRVLKNVSVIERCPPLEFKKDCQIWDLTFCPLFMVCPLFGMSATGRFHCILTWKKESHSTPNGAKCLRLGHRTSQNLIKTYQVLTIYKIIISCTD